MSEKMEYRTAYIEFKLNSIIDDMERVVREIQKRQEKDFYGLLVSGLGEELKSLKAQYELVREVFLRGVEDWETVNWTARGIVAKYNKRLEEVENSLKIEYISY